jgi:hypothetical protein
MLFADCSSQLLTLRIHAVLSDIARNCVVEMRMTCPGGYCLIASETKSLLIEYAFLPDFRGLGAGQILLKLCSSKRNCSKPLDFAF